MADTNNLVNRLTGISYVKSSVTLASVSYTVDAVGNRTPHSGVARPAADPLAPQAYHGGISRWVMRHDTGAE